MNNTLPKQKMGFMKKIKLRMSVLMFGRYDDFIDLFSLKQNPDKSRNLKRPKKSKSDGNVFADGHSERKTGNRKTEKLKNKKLDAMKTLKIDAVPLKSKNSSPGATPAESPTSDYFTEESDEDFHKYTETREECEPPVEELTTKNLTLFKNKEKTSDNTVTAEDESNDSPKNYSKQFHNKVQAIPKRNRYRDPFGQKSRRSNSESQKHFNYSAQSNTYHISNSKDIHIGPTYKQQILINSVDPTTENNFNPSIKETDEIKAIKSNEELLTDEIIDLMSEHIGRNWQFFGRRVGFSKGQIDIIQMDNQYTKDRVYKLLTNWRNEKPDEVTLAKLSNALWDVGEKQAVELLAKHVFESGVE